MLHAVCRDMLRAWSPNVALPQFETALPKVGSSLESRVASNEEPVSLVLTAAGEGRLDEHVNDLVLEQWFEAAASAKSTLLVLMTVDTLELYSTQCNFSAACTRPLESVAGWSKKNPQLRQFQITFLRGVPAVRRFFANVAGIGSMSGGTPVDGRQLATTTRLARRAGCLCHTTASLLRAAKRVNERVVLEVFDGDPSPNAALREWTAVGAERIVEEELLLWRTEQVERHRALARRSGSPARRST
ncbi:MAG: hypothetical protein QM784_11420 [Polyangiaceae bacterium]